MSVQPIHEVNADARAAGRTYGYQSALLPVTGTPPTPAPKPQKPKAREWPRKIPKVCPVCNAPFMAARQEARYCSSRCKDLAETERRRQQRIELKNGGTP